MTGVESLLVATPSTTFIHVHTNAVVYFPNITPAGEINALCRDVMSQFHTL